jgi:SM-20-related protein
MRAVSALPSDVDSAGCDETLFARIARDIECRGFSVCPGALPPDLALSLHDYAGTLPASQFQRAGVGRGGSYLHNDFVRKDEICWITGEDPPCAEWLAWCSALQQFLNRRLFLGPFSFESHFACYGPGDFYRRHYDAFRGEANRVLSVVAYLNPGWGPGDGGELLLYRDDADREGLRVVPLLGTLVVFLSQEFPHEVLPAARQRLSIAGWYRLNTSSSTRPDPPL